MKNRSPKEEKFKYDPEIYRGIEKARGFLGLNADPIRTGPETKPVDFWDYHFAVLVALGQATTIHTDIFDDAMEEGDLSAFTKAVEDVRRIREKGLSTRAKVMVSLLSAKLALEAEMGFLPTPAKVKRAARDHYKWRFGGEAPPLTDSSGWRRGIEDAGLEYLKA